MAKIYANDLFGRLDKGEIAPVYLLTGEEGYFIDRALARIVATSLKGAPREFNLDVFYAKDASPDEVVSQASTLPMLADRRVVVLKEADKLKDLGPITAYLASPSKTTVFVMVAENVERSKEEKLVKAIQADGVSVHLYHPKEAELAGWIKTLAKESGYTIANDAVEYLKDALGGNLALTESELGKGFDFVGDRKAIGFKDVQASVGNFGSPVVFELVDATALKRPGKAAELLAGLISDGEEPLMILGVMAGHWRRLIDAKERKLAGDDDEKVAKALRLNFMNKKSFLTQVSKMTEGELLSAMSRFRQADADMKGGSGMPPRIVMERLVLGLAGVKGL